MIFVLTLFVLFCLSSTFCFKFSFNLSEVAQTFAINQGNSLSLTLFLGCSLAFLLCTTVPDNWRAVFDLGIPSRLLLDAKLCTILFIVRDSVYLNLSCETGTVSLVNVLVKRPFKSEGPGNLISFGFKLIFYSGSATSLFFKFLLNFFSQFSFALLTSS